MKNFELKNKVAIITGGAGFLGTKHAEALAELGCNIVLFDKINGNQVAHSIKKKYNCECDAFKGDVTNERSIKDLLKFVTKNYKRIDILINNAAIDPKISNDNLNFTKLETFSLSNWKKEIDVGLTGAFLCSKIFGTVMSKNNGGVIINISSDLGIIAPNHNIYNTKMKKNKYVKPVTYSVIKHGIIGLTKYISTYWPEKNVRSNALCIGGIKNNQPKEFIKKLSELIPMNRMAEPDEYKSAIQFLCSDASKYMNGSSLIIDGGRTAW